MLLVIWFGTAHPRDACQVLSPRDVAAVQGARFKSKKLTETHSGSVDVSQCFYALPRHSDSVTVDVIRGKAREFFQKHFANVTAEAGSRIAPASTKQGGEREARTLRVRGVGESAVWSGNRLAGALYVLKGDAVLRVSVGGTLSEEQKIDRARQLAARALRRL